MKLTNHFFPNAERRSLMIIEFTCGTFGKVNDALGFLRSTKDIFSMVLLIRFAFWGECASGLRVGWCAVNQVNPKFPNARVRIMVALTLSDYENVIELNNDDNVTSSFYTFFI